MTANTDSKLISTEAALSAYRSIHVSEAQTRRFSNGGELDLQRIKTKTEDGEIYTVFGENGDFLGLGRSEDGDLKPLRLLPRNQ